VISDGCLNELSGVCTSGLAKPDVQGEKCNDQALVDSDEYLPLNGPFVIIDI
jgi:hypothetical protein